jgi:hypothetical protein
MKNLLWLDDCRDPLDKEVDWLVFSPIGRNVEVWWVKSYVEFVSYIEEFGLPDGINFDHDLADTHYTPQEYWGDYHASKSYQESIAHSERTGMDCVKWLVDYCIDNEKDLPLWYCHSANPVGRDNMDNYLSNYLKSIGSHYSFRSA